MLGAHDSPLSPSEPVTGPHVAVVSGGVGAARFLRGLCDVVAPDEIAAIVNTGDDTVLHGLSISPDLDTITYTLAGAIDPERGWGLAGETWQAMAALARYAEARPPTSAAAATWFNLGDRDLATHLYRTARLAEGATATDATPTPAVVDALEHAATIVIAPSNPIVSIGPIRALPGVEDVLGRRRDDVVAVSPIVGGAALKGPADHMLSELGHEPSVVGVARLYAPIASRLVIDPVDAPLAGAVAAAGIVPLVQPSIMSSPPLAADLARATIGAT